MVTCSNSFRCDQYPGVHHNCSGISCMSENGIVMQVIGRGKPASSHLPHDGAHSCNAHMQSQGSAHYLQPFLPDDTSLNPPPPLSQEGTNNRETVFECPRG